MAQAKDALERLSEDPSARAMAEARKKAEVYNQRRDARSRAEGRAEAVIVLLSARGITVTDEARARIVACHDFPTIERWLVRAANAASLDELFAD